MPYSTWTALNHSPFPTWIIFPTLRQIRFQSAEWRSPPGDHLLMPVMLEELREDSRSCLPVMSFVFRWLYTPGRGATIQNNHSLRVKRRKSWEALQVTLRHSVIPLKSNRGTWPCGCYAMGHSLTGLTQRLKGWDKSEWSLESLDGSSEALALWSVLSNPSLSEETPVSTYLLSSWLTERWGQQKSQAWLLLFNPDNSQAKSPWIRTCGIGQLVPNAGLDI